jgi:hypothetical protein
MDRNQDTCASDARAMARMIEDEAAQRNARMRGEKRFNTYGCK